MGIDTFHQTRHEFEVIGDNIREAKRRAQKQQPSRPLSVAITKLDEARMWLNEALELLEEAE